VAKTVNKLTDVQVRQWMATGQPINKSDGDGLSFTLSSGGTASWILRYRIGDKQKELSLGRYPDITIKKARQLARDERARVSQGVDVGRAKQQQKAETAAASSFKQLATDYMDKVFPGLAQTTVKQRKQHIEAVILPKLGSMPAKEITSLDVVEFIRATGKTKTPNVLELVFTAVSAIFKHGIATSSVTINPCVGLSLAAICGKAVPRRTRLMLSEDELRVILPAIPSMGIENALMFYILLHTGVRIGELTKAKWEHVDFDRAVWVVPDGNSKAGTGYSVPLTPKLAEYFHALHTIACGSSYVFPARQIRRSQNYGGDVHCEHRTFNKNIHELCNRLGDNVRRFTSHDIRSTVRGHLAVLGVDIIVAERCLNHRIGGLVGVYSQHDYMNERRAALEKLESFITACESGAEWSAISMRTRVAE